MFLRTQGLTNKFINFVPLRKYTESLKCFILVDHSNLKLYVECTDSDTLCFEYSKFTHLNNNVKEIFNNQTNNENNSHKNDKNQGFLLLIKDVSNQNSDR